MDKIGSGLILKGVIRKEDEVLWTHPAKIQHCKTTAAGKANGEEVDRNMYQDIQAWTKLDIAAASKLASNRER